VQDKGSYYFVGPDVWVKALIDDSSSILQIDLHRMEADCNYQVLRGRSHDCLDVLG
jgi:hypothetical protein